MNFLDSAKWQEFALAKEFLFGYWLIVEATDCSKWID